MNTEYHTKQLQNYGIPLSDGKHEWMTICNKIQSNILEDVLPSIYERGLYYI